MQTVSSLQHDEVIQFVQSKLELKFQIIINIANKLAPYSLTKIVLRHYIYLNTILTNNILNSNTYCLKRVPYPLT